MAVVPLSADLLDYVVRNARAGGRAPIGANSPLATRGGGGVHPAIVQQVMRAHYNAQRGVGGSHGTQGRGGGVSVGLSQPIAQRFQNRGGGGARPDFNREQQAIQLAQQGDATQRQHELEKIALSGGIDRATQADRLLAADHNLRNELKFRGMDADADRRLRMLLTQVDQQFRGEQAGLERQHDQGMLQQQYGLMQQRDELGFYQEREAQNSQWMATMAQQKGLMNPEAASRWDTTRRQLAKVEEMRGQLSPVEYYQARSQVFDEAKRYDWQNNMDDPIKKIGVFDYFTHPDGKGGTQYMKIGVSGKATPEELQQWGQNQFIQVPGVGWMTLSPDGGNSTFYPESKLGQQTSFDFGKMYDMGMKVLSRQGIDPDTQMQVTINPTHEEVMEWMQFAREAQGRISNGQPLWSPEDYDRMSIGRLRNVYRDQYGPAKAHWDNNRKSTLQATGRDIGEYYLPPPNDITPQQLYDVAPSLGFPQFKRNPVAPAAPAETPTPQGDIESHTLGRMSVQGPEANRMAPPPRQQQPMPVGAQRMGTAGRGQSLMPGLQLPPEMQTMGPQDRPPPMPARQQLMIPQGVPLDEMGQPMLPPQGAMRPPMAPPGMPQRPPVTMPDVEAAAMQREAAGQQLGRTPRVPAAETQGLPVMTLEEAEAANVDAFVTPDGIVYKRAP